MTGIFANRCKTGRLNTAKNTMIYFTLFFISGIAARHFFPFFPITIILLLIFLFSFLFIKLKTDRKKPVILMLVFLSGFVYSGIRDRDKQQAVLHEEESHVMGTISHVPEMYNENSRLILEDVYINGKKFHGRIRLHLSERFSRYQPYEDSISVGQRISAFARLREPTEYQNPGLFSYDARKDGIYAVGYVRQMSVVGMEDGFLIGVNRLRQRLGKIIDNSLTHENAAFLKAIIPGLKKGITPEARDAFSSTGLAHLLSISGTHFGLLAFIIFTLVKTSVKLLPFKLLSRLTLYITPTRGAVIFTLPLLFVYALISGSSTPTIRALVMICIYMLALLLGRKNQWLNSLSIAAFVILLWQPSGLFDISFQLSFTAVFFIGIVLERKKRMTPFHTEQRSSFSGIPQRPRSGSLFMDVCERVKTAMLITIAAVLGTAPFIILYFKQFPPVSPITNLIVTPLVCFIILPLGFFSSFSAVTLKLAILPFHSIIEEASRLTLSLVHIFSHIPYGNLRVHNPSFFILGLYFIALIFIVKSRRKWRGIPLLIFIVLYMISPLALHDEYPSITFLDVGQGDASVIELPDKKILLIDGGRGEPDMGRQVIAPFLWSRGIRGIDYLVVSHNHPDHYGGLLYIMDTFRIGEIWINGRPGHGMENFFQKAIHNNIRRKSLRRGDILEGNTYRIAILHPYEEFFAGSPRGDFSNENSDSLVLRLDTWNSSVLFTGDIETEAEENMMHLGPWLRSDVLKVPHHGGRTSSSRTFLEAVSPRVAVASVGRYNRFHHPHAETVERYMSRGIKMYRTDRNGAVTIKLTNSASLPYEIITHRDRTLSPVQAPLDELKNLALLF